MAVMGEHQLLPRSLYSSAPPPQTTLQMNPTLLVSWWCTLFSLAIILFRLAGRWIRTERMYLEDKIIAVAIIPLLIRMGFAHMVLRNGTNNALTDTLSPADIAHRVTGSKMVLPARIFYAAFLWTAKLAVAEFLRRMFSATSWKKSFEWIINTIRAFLVVTFFAVLVATLSECHPFHSYWQVTPDPGPHCRQGFVQLLTIGATDVITDLALVAFPIWIVLQSNWKLQRKITLCFLFAFSLILVAITIYRVVETIERHGDQQFRSLLASIEILVATAVSNALVLGSFVRDRGAKKAKFKFGSVGGDSSIDRPQSARTRRRGAVASWGSDDELAEELGMHLGPRARGGQGGAARPAPAAQPLLPEDGRRRRKHSGASDSSSDDEAGVPAIRQTTTASTGQDVPTPRGMNFFDVGGLVDDDPPRRPSAASVVTPTSDNFSITPLVNSTRHRSPHGNRAQDRPGTQDSEMFQMHDLRPVQPK